MSREPYDSDITDIEWLLLEPLIPHNYDVVEGQPYLVMHYVVSFSYGSAAQLTNSIVPVSRS